MAGTGKKIRIDARTRTKLRIRKKIQGSKACPRLSVFRSGRHTYAQVICDETSTTIAAASTRDKDVLSEAQAGSSQGGGQGEAGQQSGVPVNPLAKSGSTKGFSAAHAVGRVVAKRALSKGITKVVFDRGGFVYHGRVRAIAEGARAAGLVF